MPNINTHDLYYWTIAVILISVASIIIGGIGAILICIFFYD
jgi:hypothetical protein